MILNVRLLKKHGFEHSWRPEMALTGTPVNLQTHVSFCKYRNDKLSIQQQTANLASCKLLIANK